MRKFIWIRTAIAACAALMLWVTPQMASAQETSGSKISFPGWTWGDLGVTPFGSSQLPDKNNLVYAMKLVQGIDWLQFNQGRSSFITYATVGLTADTKGEAWNNYVQPGVGFMIRNRVWDGVIDLYAEGYHKAYWGPGAFQSGTGFKVGFSYWFGWDLKKRSP